MKLLLLLGLVAVAIAKIPSKSWESEHFLQAEFSESVFKPNREYRFKYNGQLATGIPGSSKQHAATRIQAQVSLVLKGEQQALLQIVQIRVGRLNKNLYNPREMVPFMSFQEVPIQQQALQELSLPVMFQYNQGLVEDVVFDGQEQPWSANIKRGILNLLQVNLNKRNEINLSEEARLSNSIPSTANEEFDFFTTQEKTVEGQCMTHYTVVSNPSVWGTSSNVLNVTRSIDYENCRVRPEVKYNFRFQDPCEFCSQQAADSQKYLKSSSVAKFNISGTPQQFIIQSAILESQYQIVPFNRKGNMITTYTNQSLVLLSSGRVQTQVRQPSNPVQSDSGLMYTLDWDQDMELFLMKGHKEAQLPIPINNRIQIISEVLRPLVSEMRQCVSEEVPELYYKLVEVIRYTEKQDLPKIFSHFVHQQPESFSSEEHIKIKSILIDSLADAGSKDTVSFLLQLIKQKKISSVRATLVLKQLINLRTPSQEIVQEFLSFIQAPVVQNNWLLKQSAYLTLGSIVQGLCMPSEDKLALLPRSSAKLPSRIEPNTQLCPQELQQQLLQKMYSELEQSSSYEDKILALKTIGNMGLPQSIIKLQQIIQGLDQEQSKIVRIEAIMALRQLRELIPNKIVKILMPIFMDRQESSHVRMAAVYEILNTHPSRPIIEQISRKLFSERSRQVASFVYTFMTTMANSSNPCEQKFAKDIQLALRHGRKISGAFLPQYSKFVHSSLHSQKYNLGADLSFTSVINNRTFVPQVLSASLHTSFLGFWSKYLVTVGVAQSNVESLFQRYLRRTEFSDLSLEEILSRSPKAASSPLKELKQIWKQLAIVARQQLPSDPKGFMFMKFKDQEFFMLPFSQKMIQRMPSVQEIRRVLQQGQHINVHKAAVLHEIMHKIPTAIGLPLITFVSVPVVTQISGQVRVETSPLKVHLNNLKPSIASSVLSSVEVWSPIVSTGLKIRANAKVCAPVSAKLTVNLQSSTPSVKLSVSPAQQQVEYVKLETRPSTFTKIYRFPMSTYPQAQEQTILGEQWNRISNVRDIQAVQKVEQWVRKILGLPVRVEGLWHHTPVSTPSYIPFCPLSGPNHLTIRTQQPSSQSPKEYVVKVEADLVQAFSGKLNSVPFEMEDQEYQYQQYSTSNGYQTVIKTQLFTRGAQQERKLEMQTQFQCAEDLRVCKVDSQVHVSPIPALSSRKFKVCLQASTQFPSYAASFSELIGKTVVGQLKTTWGYDQCRENNKIQLKVAAQHSSQQQSLFESEPEYSYYSQQRCSSNPALCSPVELSQSLSAPQQLLQYKLVAQYNNVSPIVKNVTAKIYKALKYYYYWNTDSINFNLQNPSNQIKAVFTVDSKTKQFFNLTMWTPVENVTIRDALLPVQMLYPVNVRPVQNPIRSVADLFESVMNPVLAQCQINSQRVQTFDQVSYRSKLSTCWTVLAKDCADESSPAFVVLMKKLSQQSSQKKVKIVSLRHKIVLEPSSSEYDSIKVKVNGKVLGANQYPSTQSYQIEKLGDRVRVVLPYEGVTVNFDGYSAQVKVSPMSSSALCGICGHYDGEPMDEFRTASSQLTSDVRSFIQSYTLNEDSCDYPSELSQISEDEDLSYVPSWKYSWESPESQTSEESFSGLVQPVLRLATEEQGNKICFSTEQIAQCPSESYPVDYQEETRVTFRCLHRSHPMAHTYLRLARQQSQIPSDMESDLSGLETSYDSEISVPLKCQWSQY